MFVLVSKWSCFPLHKRVSGISISIILFSNSKRNWRYFNEVEVFKKTLISAYSPLIVLLVSKQTNKQTNQQQTNNNNKKHTQSPKSTKHPPTCTQSIINPKVFFLNVMKHSYSSVNKIWRAWRKCPFNRINKLIKCEWISLGRKIYVCLCFV